MAIVQKIRNPSLLGSVLLFSFLMIMLIEGMFLLLAGVAMERGQLVILAEEIQAIHEQNVATETPCPEIIAPESEILDPERPITGESTYSIDDDLFNQLRPLGIINVIVSFQVEEVENCRSNFIISDDIVVGILSPDTTILEINLEEGGVLAKLNLGFQSLINRMINPDFLFQATFASLPDSGGTYVFEYTIANESLNTLQNSLEVVIVPSLFILVLNLALITMITVIYISHPLQEVSNRIKYIRNSISRGDSSVQVSTHQKEAKRQGSKISKGLQNYRSGQNAHGPRLTVIKEFKEISKIQRDLSLLESRLNPVDVISIKEKSTLHDTRNIYSNISKLIRILVEYTGKLDPKDYKRISKQNFVLPDKIGNSDPNDGYPVRLLMSLVQKQHEEIQFKLRQLIRYATSETQFSDLKEFPLKALLDEVRQRGIVKAMVLDIDSIAKISSNSLPPIDIVWTATDEQHVVYAIEKDLQDIVYNFIENSVKAINLRKIAEKEVFNIEGAKGLIRLSADQAEVTQIIDNRYQKVSMSVITIEDNGIGIEDYERKNLFKFELGGSDTKRVDAFDADSGIGLYYCKQQISRLGGDIELVKTRNFDAHQVESTGTTFKIFIPEKQFSPHYLNKKQPATNQ